MLQRTFIAALLVCAAFNGFSQQQTLGFMTGGTLSRVGTVTYLDYRPGLSSAVYYQRRSGIYLFEGAIDYTQKGSRRPIDFMNSDAYIAEGTIEHVYDYVGISLKTGAYYGDKLFGATLIGLAPAGLVHAERRSSEVAFPNETIPEKRYKLENMPFFDLSLTLETRIGYRLGTHSAIVLSVGGSLGLTEIHYDQPPNFPPSQWHNHNLTARVGYAFSF